MPRRNNYKELGYDERYEWETHCWDEMSYFPRREEKLDNVG